MAKDYSTSRGNTPSPGSASVVVFVFLDGFTCNHDSSGLKMDASLGRCVVKWVEPWESEWVGGV